ncbi:rhomboid family intramembrane serine protease [Rhodoblastus sp.]|uniref:rhomboid family intramembrane serine protease n=1 Tax=Rhodoblastus sp. TaxID=1962975 RepID=UPI003F966516
MRERGREPIFNLPAVVVFLLAILTVIQIARSQIAPELDGAILATFGFTPARFAFLVDQTAVLAHRNDIASQSDVQAQVGAFFLPHAPPAWLWFTPLSYAFLHGGATHLVFNGIWLAAFGSPVARRFGSGRFLLLGVLGAVAGAAAYLAVHPLELAPMIGASAAISAYMGAAARFVFPIGGFYRADSSPAPLQSIREMIANRQTMAFVAIWFISNMLMGLGGQALGVSAAPIAWEAHIGGFLAGLFCAPLFDQRRKG